MDDLRRNWRLWERLPDTRERYVNVPDLQEGIGVLSTLLLRKGTYASMVGGDGACMGCGEKTAVHLIVSAIFATMQPRVERQVAHLGELITALEGRYTGGVYPGDALRLEMWQDANVVSFRVLTPDRGGRVVVDHGRCELVT